MRPARLACLMLIAAPFAVFAEGRAALAKSIMASNGTPPCVGGVTKTASISVNFNGTEKTLAAARSAVDAARIAMEAEAKKAGDATLTPSNYYYNINANTAYNNNVQEQQFGYSGNLNYQVNDEALAQKMADRLAEQKRQFSININANRCEMPLDGAGKPTN